MTDNITHHMDEFCGSKFWDTNRIWLSPDPDFTKCFEKTVLVWGPCAFFWLFSIFDFYYLKISFDRNIPWNKLNISKLVLNSALLILTAVDFVMATVTKSNEETATLIYPVDIWMPVIKFATFLLLIIFIPLNRKYGVQTSGAQFLFWFMLVIFSIAQCRTEVREYKKRNTIIASDALSKPDYSWDEYNYVSFMIYYALSCVMLVLNCFADAMPNETKYNRTSKEIPESSASFLSRITFTWLDSLAWKGYRKPLLLTDLWDLKAQDSCKEIMPIFAYYWNQNIQQNFKYEKTTSPSKAQLFNGKVKFENPHDRSNGKKVTSSIWPPIIKSFGGVFALASLLKLITDVLIFVQPQVLSLVISFVEDYADNEKESQPEWKGILYSLLLFFIAGVQTVITAQQVKGLYVVGLRIRTALINAIYRKALVISNATRKESTVGEIVNLMAVDAQRFIDLTLYLNMLWSAPLQIGLAMYFLWQQLGPSVLAGLAVMVIIIPLNGVIANRIKNYQIKQMKYKDDRVRLMNEVLNGVKVLKLYAWEPSFEKQVLELREKEISTLKSAAYLNTSTLFLWSCAPFLVSLATFATYILVDENNVLDATKIFVSLTLFNILRFPLILLPMLISNMIQTQVSVKRINKFMNSEELDPNSVQHDPNESDPMIIKKGTFSWGDDEAILKNIDMTVKKGTLCAVVGTVGSGKSSLIQALLGEMDKLSGRVNTVGSVAYVPQQAWIQNATLRDNILFGLEYDRKRYNRVIDACALRSDIEMLSAGDQTEIGEKGINLSGGQKQRVSLARAVYSNADLYLLDDPLSAVDSHVGKHIFEKVIGPNGLLEQKTRVLVTHGITFLSQTNNIYVMKLGEISENGTYEELLARKGAFAEFIIQHLQDTINEVEDLDEIKQQLEGTVQSDELLGTLAKVISIARSNSISDSVSVKSLQTKGNGSLKQKKIDRQISAMSTISTVSQNKIAQLGDGKLIEIEKSETGNIQLAVYKHYVKSIGIFLSAAAVILSAAFQSFSIGSNLWLTKWSSDQRVVNDTSVRDMYLGVYGAFGIGQVICSYFSTLSISLGCLSSSHILHNLLTKNIFRQPMEFFDTTPIGRIVNRFSKDIETTDNALPSLWGNLFMHLFSALATIVIISLSSTIFLAVVVPMALLYYFAQRFYVATSRQLMRLESVTRSPIYTHFSETITGVTTIRAYMVQERFINESEQRVDTNQVCKYPSLIMTRWLGIRLEMVGNLIILFSALFAVLGGQSNAGLVGLAVTYALQVTQTLNWLVRFSSDLETNIVSVERIKEYSETKQEAPWKLENSKVSRDWPVNGEVIFENFKVRYREGLDLVLRGISFTIAGGEKVGIVGRTGAGKSSLTLSLFRIIESAGGRILIDGIDIATLGLHMLRSRLTIIPQDPVLFSGSLRLNLDPFETKSDDEIWKALELSHLKTFVKTLTAGLNHEINEGGENLSVGQRQLVCLARALLRKTKLLVLDEATAAVDLETDDLIQKTIRSEFKDCTILTIAHRLNTILDSDRVIVLDKGEVIEFASPTELLDNPNSTFYSMAKDANIV